ncbi:MAG: helix-turn-helix transcriptional regulator [Thalassotalea sp.]
MLLQKTNTALINLTKTITTSDRFVREAECKQISGLSRTRRWELERDGKFPKRIQLSERAIAWRLSDLMAWIEERANETA